MRSIQVVARGEAQFIEVPKPEIRPGHALVRTTYLSLCGSDIQMLHHREEEAYPFPPGTTGHEMVGVVEQIGDADAPIQAHDQVLALAPGHRAMSEYFLAPYHHILKLPADIPVVELLQAQQLGTVLYAAQTIPDVTGKNVVVIGQGSAGLWFNFQLRRMGARRIVALDIEDFRLERSVAYGATSSFNNRNHDPVERLRETFDGELADLVIEAAGEIETINLAVDLVRKFGDILYFGVPRGQTIPYEFAKFFHKCCRATTIVGSTDDPKLATTQRALDLIASGEADAKGMLTHQMPFDDVIDAYRMHRHREDGALKIIIEMPGAEGAKVS